MRRVVPRAAGLKKLKRLFVSFVGMLGLRLDHASFSATFIAWALVFAGTLAVYGYVFYWGDIKPAKTLPWALGYAVIVWGLYYGGLTCVLGTRLRAWLIKRFGEQGARRGFNAVLGIVFLHQGLAQGAVADCSMGMIAGPPGWLMVGGAFALIGLGTAVKLWATYASSLDIYYYNDMFVGRPVHETTDAIAHGPFKYFKNPMYGVGNLQAYGSALLVGSWYGLVVAGAYHASLYVFYFAIERPFVLRTYATRPAEN